MPDVSPSGRFPGQRNRAIRRQVYALAIPIAANNLLQRGVGVVDTVMVGHVGADQLAAVGLSQILILSATAFVYCLAIGSAVLIARHTGAEEYDPRRWVGNTALTGGVFAGLTLGTILALLGGRVAGLIGARGTVLTEATNYLEIIGVAYVFMALIQISSSIFQGAGDSRTPLYVVVGVNAIHILVAYPLIFGAWGLPRLGVRGAALGTLISEFLGAAVLIVLLSRKRLVMLRARAFQREQFRRIVRLGLPILGERLLTHSMQILYARLVLGFGVAAFAAHQIGLNIEAMSFLQGLGFSQAATTLVGQNLGAGRPERATRAGYQAAIVGVFLMSLFGIAFLLVPEFWVSLFTSDPAVQAYGVRYLRIVAFMQPGIAAAMVMSGSLRGAGDTQGPMYGVLIGAWALRMPLGWIVGKYVLQDVTVCWLAMAIDWNFRGLFLFLRYRRRGWLGREA